MSAHRGRLCLDSALSVAGEGLYVGLSEEGGMPGRPRNKFGTVSCHGSAELEEKQSMELNASIGWTDMRNNGGNRAGERTLNENNSIGNDTRRASGPTPIAYLTSSSNFVQISPEIRITKQRNPEKYDPPEVFDGRAAPSRFRFVLFREW
ncbi:hypothetical protein B0H16DRAFT_1462015 [Mycena metata]|uniref:Uncharacterized protein n=1 Tax=Mycena metata TaxID=1033252 RepID=A0AAD7N670_9AGAR|nr:hypothetical protein B0H16DRAFT_1462015 [Mycena metata]